MEGAWETVSTGTGLKRRLKGNAAFQPDTMFTVRAADQADAEALLSLARRFSTSFTVDEAAFVTSFNELLTAPHACLLVAQDEAKVRGYVLGFEHFTFYANGRVAWVEEIMVEENCRRIGVGTRLMRGFEQWAATRGARLTALATRRASEFYTALGYEESAAYFRKLLSRGNETP